MRRNGSFLSLARATAVDTSPSPEWIWSSISRTAWLAPPWSGPDRAWMPAAIEEKIFAWLEPTRRTAEDEQFCPWSAWRMKRTLSAREMMSLGMYSSDGTENIMWRKREEYSRSLRGYT